MEGWKVEREGHVGRKGGREEGEGEVGGEGKGSMAANI